MLSPLRIRNSASPLLSTVSLLAAFGFFMALAFMVLGVDFASADDFCVNMPAATACAATFNANLPGALSAADANPGNDRVLIGPVTRSNMNGFNYSDLSGGTVDIVGSGPSTVLTGVDTTGDATLFNLAAPPGSRIEDLTLKVPANLDINLDYGLELTQGTTAQNIHVRGEPGTSHATGIDAFAANVVDADIDLPHSASPSYGIMTRNLATIADSTIKTDVGIQVGSRDTATFISNTRIDSNIGVDSESGTTNIGNSLIKLETAPTTVGIRLQDLSDNTYPINANLDGVSIVNDDASPAGTGIISQADSGMESSTVNMTNTVIAGTGKSLRMVADNGHQVKVSTSYSAYDQAGLTQNPGSGSIAYSQGAGDLNLPGDPLFLNELGPDYVPLPQSPLTDAGNPVAPPAGTTDLVGTPRACHGTESGVIRRDIGAFEGRTVLSDDCSYPDTTIVSGPGATTTDPTPPFSYRSSKDSSSFRCSFDGAARVNCGSFSDAPNLGLGAHTVSVVAVDAYGNVDQTPATRTYTVLRPPDRTAPKVIIRGKVPKKTKKRVVKIRFKSNEAGSKFTCKLNRGKAKKCKSPFKVKLKKGRKSTIRIVATDRAGNRSKAKVLKLKSLR